MLNSNMSTTSSPNISGHMSTKKNTIKMVKGPLSKTKNHTHAMRVGKEQQANAMYQQESDVASIQHYSSSGMASTGGLVGSIGDKNATSPCPDDGLTYHFKSDYCEDNVVPDIDHLVSPVTKIQAAFRGYRARKQVFRTLHSQNQMFRQELKSKDVTLLQMEEKLKYKDTTIMDLEKNIQDLQKHISSISMSYEARLTEKDAEIEKLKIAFENNKLESGVKSKTVITRKEVDDIKTQLSNLMSLRDSDLANKDAEIKDLKTKLMEASRSMDSTPKQRLMSNSSPHPLLQQRSLSEADTLRASPTMGPMFGTMATGAPVMTTTPCQKNPILTVGGLSKSIWAPVSGTIQPFGYFNTEVNMENDVSITTEVHINQYRSLWSPLDAPSDSPTDFSSESGKTVNDNLPAVFMDDHYRESSPTKTYPGSFPMDVSLHSGVAQLVDKIVKTNDQSASLLLQQKLRISTPETKDVIFGAIMQQALALMKNRFGNFLMQRCIEFGSKEHVQQIGLLMKGNVASLACDRFACHVVQKAIDFLEHDMKSSIVVELFLTLPNTLTHKFACHVWQRVFETKWPGNECSMIFQRVFESLQNQWHHIANDENGSLVIQCIFENCGEVTRMAIMSEILCHAVDIAKGQWGNWVIQHILDHGSVTDKKYILKMVTQNVFTMSIDQYASKVVEKALKSASSAELYQIVDIVLECNNRVNGQVLVYLIDFSSRPFLLDMMNNQYANYVVQHVLTLAESSQREACIRIIRPHVATLRHSKYGQRVAAIVEKSRTSPPLLHTPTNSSSPYPFIPRPMPSHNEIGWTFNHQQ